MYPIQDVDAQLLLATLTVSKRRPASLPEIVAAAELFGWPVTAARAWAAAFERFATHGLLAAAEGGYALTPAGQTLVAGLPKKAEPAERVFLMRERLAAYEPVERGAAIPMSAEQFEAAIRAHAEFARQGGMNMLMPKPRPNTSEPPRGGKGRKPFGATRRRP